MPATGRDELLVYIEGINAGSLRQLPSGSLRFSYRRGYSGPPLSLRMPVDGGPYGDGDVRSYLLGLLPDNREQRLAVGEEYGVRRDNPFRLLEHLGLDCPGAVQFCSADRLETLISREDMYIELDDESIGAELRRLRGDFEASWQTAGEHWSLGGAQAKLALAFLNGRWWRCEGSAATTHILKPGIAGSALQALNEALCLRLAARCGVPAVEASYRSFSGEGAIVVKRYDRTMPDGTKSQSSLPLRGGMGMDDRFPMVLRRHQEDFCQALGVPPDHKYANEGGPATRDILRALDSQPNATNNKLVFTLELLFNYLVGAPDAHAKNYSILLRREGPVMAPLYDCASGFPYEPEGGRRGRPFGAPGTLAYARAAMSIGGENRFFRVGRNAIERYARVARMDPPAVLDLAAQLALRMHDLVDTVIDEVASDAEGDDAIQRAIEDLRLRLAEPIRRHAEAVVGML